jgi:hypothetical protein
MIVELEHDFLDEKPKHMTLWRLWAKALGEKASENDTEADAVAIFRTVLAAINLVTCIFIIASILRHW